MSRGEASGEWTWSFLAKSYETLDMTEVTRVIAISVDIGIRLDIFRDRALTRFCSEGPIIVMILHPNSSAIACKLVDYINTRLLMIPYVQSPCPGGVLLQPRWSVFKTLPEKYGN